MKINRMFLKCELCGNIIGMIEDSGATPVCCGQKMTLLKANTTDAAQEKHVPVIKKEGSSLKVTVGSATHPMTEEHHISWIAVAGKGFTYRKTLSHTGSPEEVFCINEKGPMTVYAYCNLHGLWAADAE